MLKIHVSSISYLNKNIEKKKTEKWSQTGYVFIVKFDERSMLNSH